MSGFTSSIPHAPGTSPGTISQGLSVDTTVNMMVQMTPLEDLELAKTDYYSRGPEEERLVFPGLTLSAAGASSYGAGQGMDTWIPPLVPYPVAESCPQAVAFSSSVAHQTSHTRNLGAGQSTHFWDDVEPYTEQERSSVHATATTFAHMPVAGITNEANDLVMECASCLLPANSGDKNGLTCNVCYGYYHLQRINAKISASDSDTEQIIRIAKLIGWVCYECMVQSTTKLNNLQTAANKLVGCDQCQACIY